RFGTRVEFVNHARAYSFKVEGVSRNEYPMALDNLGRLGLIEFKDDYPQGFEAWEAKVGEDSKRLFEEGLKDESNKAWAATVPGAGGFVHYRGIFLTDLGRAFVNICMKGLK